MFEKEEERFNNILKLVRTLPLDQISILTGKNGSGKSLLRRLLSIRAKKEGELVVHSSQELRTSSHPMLGAFSSFASDVDWLPTSLNTLNIISSLPLEDNFLVLDELEIGCSEETILAITLWLNEWLPEQHIKGSLVITHSRHIVENLNYDNWFNLEGMTQEEWINRPIKPTDLEQLKENSLGKYITYLKKTAEQENLI